MIVMTRFPAKAALLTLSVFFFIAGVMAADDPVPFIVNKGQCEQTVLFYARTFGGTVFVDDNGDICYRLHRTDASNSSDLTITEKFLSEAKPDLHGRGQAITNISFFKDQGLSQWKSYVPTYDLIDLDSVCTGVSVTLSAFENTFEKRFEIEAGSDSRALEIQVEPADGLAVTASGDMTLNTDAGQVRFIKPVAFQTDGDRTKYLDIAYVLSGDQYHFALGKRNPLLPTTIIARTQVVVLAESLK